MNDQLPPRQPFLIGNNAHDMGNLAAAALSFLTDLTNETGAASVEELADHLPWSFEETVRLRKLIADLIQNAKYHEVMYGKPGDAAKVAKLPGKSLVQTVLEAMLPKGET